MSTDHKAAIVIVISFCVGVIALFPVGFGIAHAAKKYNIPSDFMYTGAMVAAFLAALLMIAGKERDEDEIREIKAGRYSQGGNP